MYLFAGWEDSRPLAPADKVCVLAVLLPVYVLPLLIARVRGVSTSKLTAFLAVLAPLSTVIDILNIGCCLLFFGWAFACQWAVVAEPPVSRITPERLPPWKRPPTDPASPAPTEPPVDPGPPPSA